MEPPSTPDSLEVDVNLLMQKRLPKYVMNCLQAAGYDELEVIASMDTNEGEASSISKIEKYIERHHKTNPDMLPSYSTESCTSLPFEFPPGHCIRICNFIQEVKQLYRNTKSTNISTKHSRSATAKKLKLMAQPEDKHPLSVDEITHKVHDSISKWIGQQKHTMLNSLKEGKHYTVIVNNHSNGQIVAVVNCGICRTSVRLHPLNRHYQISNWTRHIKKCTSNSSHATNSRQTKLQLFPKSTVKTQSCLTKQLDSVSEGSQEVEPSTSTNASADHNLDNESNDSQVFCQAPPLLQKEGQI